MSNKKRVFFEDLSEKKQKLFLSIRAANITTTQNAAKMSLALRTVGQEERARIQSVLQTLRQMLFDRGYWVDEFEWPKASHVNTLADYERLTMIFHHNKSNEALMVVYVGEQSAGKQTVLELRDRMKSQNINHALLVLRGKLTPQGQKELTELTRVRTESERKSTARRKRIEKFSDNELLFNITQHELVPKHSAVSADEKKRIMKLFYCSEDWQLPSLLLTDPVVRYYGWSRGQLVRIERRSETAGETEFYRVVT